VLFCRVQVLPRRRLRRGLGEAGDRLTTIGERHAGGLSARRSTVDLARKRAAEKYMPPGLFGSGMPEFNG